MEFLGKRNRDGSYSISVKARELVRVGWVDFYEEASGRGYQRRETMREARAREIQRYFSRCAKEQLDPHLFELTASARYQEADEEVPVSFDPLDKEGCHLGFVKVTASSDAWMSLVDGGTRFRGIERALDEGVITGDTAFDVRLFSEMSVANEIALFLLINENQKRVRTDLSTRVVQRSLDEGHLTDTELRMLETVVPETDKWRYEASRVTGRMNGDPDSPFRALIQMPGETSGGRSVAMQAFLTSLKHMLDDKDLRARIESRNQIQDVTDFWITILKNYWGVVSDINPQARDEPKTNVLWGSIGVNSCHRALAEIVRTELSAEHMVLTRDRFKMMLAETSVAEYGYWFSKKGGRPREYPSEKGEATHMTGNSGYIRLSDLLLAEWRSSLHAAKSSGSVSL